MDASAITIAVPVRRVTPLSFDLRRPLVGEGRGEAFTGKYWDAGLSAGLSLRLIGNLGLEAGVRAGYVSTKPIQYETEGNNNWFVTHAPAYRKVKVTDLNLSLVYKF